MVPTQQNCPHNPDGWCLACVKDLASYKDKWGEALSLCGEDPATLISVIKLLKEDPYSKVNLVITLNNQLTAKTRENDTLRVIAGKVMPCMYCGVDNISKCPYGFPGCSLADDNNMYDQTSSETIQELKREIEELKRSN